jgi:hypothetical protein
MGILLGIDIGLLNWEIKQMALLKPMIMGWVN